MAEACQQAGIDNQTSFDLQLALDEACTNVITHGYEGMDPGSISLPLENLSNGVKVMMELPPNPDILVVHSSERLVKGFHLYLPSSSSSSPLIANLLAIKGISAIYVFPYEIHIDKAEIFNRKEMSLLVIKAIRKDLKPGLMISEDYDKVRSKPSQPLLGDGKTSL